MRMTTRLAWAVRFALALALVSCGESPAGPVPTTTTTTIRPATPIRLEISASDEVLLIDRGQNLVASLAFDNGATQSVAAAWSSSDPSVAAVGASTGQVVGLSNGSALLTATHLQFTATKPLRVAPDYGGQWSGTFTVTTCARDASFPVVTFCSSAAAAPTQTFQLGLTQNGLGVSGTLSLAGASGSIQGTIDDPGSLNMSGMLPLSSGGLDFSIAVHEWQSAVQGDLMSGRFLTTWSTAAATGNGRISAEFRDCARTAR